ncbi:MAG: hypothetical protein WD824_13670 [Cyclobacteriaceae bacterium]
MKKVMFALCFMFGGIVAVSAQETQDTTSNQYRTEAQSQYPKDAQGQGQDRERIQSTELPDEVKRSLEAQEYRGWLISGAFKAKGASDKSSMESDSTSTETDANRQVDDNATGAQAEEVFIVELKNGAETKTVRFGKDGQKMEGMEEDGQNTENNQDNQNEQTEQPVPNDQAAPADPNATPETTPDSEAEKSTESQNDQSTEPQTEKSTETPSDQSTETQTDQSKANDPK